MAFLKFLFVWFNHIVQAILAYIAYGFFMLWPVDYASNMAGILGRTFGPKLGVSRRARKHLQLALPNLSPAEHEQIVRDMWDNMLRTFAESPHLKKMAKLNRLHLNGLEHIEAALTKGKGVIIATGHFANWEVGPVVMWAKGFPVTTVYRKPNNILLDRLLRFARRDVTMNLLVKGRDAASGIIRALKQNNVTALLVDQKMNYGGAPLQFFGMTAMTGLATAQIALKSGAPIVIATCMRGKGADFTLNILPPLIPPVDMPKEQAMEHIMQQINDVFEMHIRQYPGQWLWLHRRWNSKRKWWHDLPATDAAS